MRSQKPRETAAPGQGGEGVGKGRICSRGDDSSGQMKARYKPGTWKSTPMLLLDMFLQLPHVLFSIHLRSLLSRYSCSEC